MESIIMILLLIIMTMHSLVGGSAVPRSAENDNQVISTNNSGECSSVVNNIVVHPGNNGTPGPMGPRGPAGPPGTQGAIITSGGTTYTRWGKRSCPNTEGTVLVYEGIASGSFFNQGGGVNFLCLPRIPEFLQHTAGQQPRRAKLHGAEYEGYPPMPAYNSIFEHNVPCAVCYTPTRGTKLMIPAKINCPSSWTREYYGYLMSHSAEHPQRNTFECMDVNGKALPGSAQNTNGAEFYFTETTCNGIPCGPYEDGKEIPCVICTI